MGLNLKDRIKKLRESMIEKQLDGVLICKRENYMYFSGFNGSFAYLLITLKDNYLITDSRYIEQANKQTKGLTNIQTKGDIIKDVSSITNDLNLNKLGFESSFISFETYNKYLENNLSKELIPLGKELDLMRSIKDEYEIDKIKKAVQLVDNAFTNIQKIIKPDITELEIAAEIEYYLKRNGAKGTSFDTIVASGIRGALPHGIASSKKVKLGEAITIDFGAIVEDYCSDMTRTIFLGKPSENILKIYDIVKKAQIEAIQTVKEGMKANELDFCARDIINLSGYEKAFGHGLGHGVGMEIHEFPTISPRSDVDLRNNMVITIEPGIYVPNLGGVRIEDMIIVNNEKPIILTESTKEVVII